MIIQRWTGKNTNIKMNRLEMDNMAVMTKPMANSFIIKSSKVDKFIKLSNENVVSESFLNKCKEASKLFNRK